MAHGFDNHFNPADEKPSEPTENDSNQQLFAPQYTWQDFRKGMRIILIVWIILFITGLIFRFAFHSYMQ